MDNVVQNINIEDIVSSNFQPSNEEKRKIEELAQLIKQFGLLDPILVRPKNGKYEIVLGIEKYQAALIAKLNKVPAIIKEIDDNTFSKYSNIDHKQAVSLNSLPTETFSKKEENSDVINLSELSKIKIEYERDDVKMNNGEFNNNMINNNLGQPEMPQNNQGPTFGGRFFPSLEDEPTNMNMMGGMNEQPTPPIAPDMNNNPGLNNNLIDLTDLSVDKEPTPMTTPDFGAPTMNIPSIESTMNLNSNPVQPTNFGMPTPEPTLNLTPENDTIINLDSLQNNNPAVQPISEPVSMETLNADFGAPATTVPQFNMGAPMDLNIPQTPEIPTPTQSEFSLNQPQMAIPTPSFDINPNPMVTPDFGTPVTIATPEITTPEPTVSTVKDVTPVTNTIKDLVTNLEKFGYKINITEEELPNSAKIIIEVEK